MITVNNRDRIDWEKGMTINDVLERMNYDYSLISVYIDDEYVPQGEHLSRHILDNASVQIIHLAHGG